MPSRSYRAASPLLATLLGCSQPTQAAPEASAEAVSLPPSGNYAVTTRVVFNDCEPPQPSDPFDAFVVVVTEGGAPKTNLPVAPVRGVGGSVARSDISLVAGEHIELRRSPVRDCRSYEVTTAIEVDSVTADSITLLHRTSYGDASACGVARPSKCTTSLELRYALKEELCAAECTRGAHPRPGVSQGPPPWEVDCACP